MTKGSQSHNSEPISASTVGLYRPTEEICTVALTRSGIRRLLNIYFELGFCGYWDNFDTVWESTSGGVRLREAGYWLKQTTRLLKENTDYHFKSPIGFRVGHILEPYMFKAGFIRLVRHPLDMLISHLDRYRALLGPDARYTLSDAIDTPLLFGQGDLFNLGPIEEWIIQECFLQEAASAIPIHTVSYEDLNSSPTETTKRLFEHSGISVPNDAITAACDHSNRKLFNTELFSDHPGSSQKWGLGGYDRAIERLSLVTSVLGNPHQYTFPISMPSQPVNTWPQPMKSEAIS
ncbi:MAG: hypothetical protein KDD53_09910, partial [Bdellovibrionales bacterium]|nr:hypothetical protein [Bdellovibrionales bacterium]